VFAGQFAYVFPLVELLEADRALCFGLNVDGLHFAVIELRRGHRPGGHAQPGEHWMAVIRERKPAI
jgi:hypothetical protein